MENLSYDEKFAYDHADQHTGCVECQKSHHETAFCECGRCFFNQEKTHNEYGTFVYCVCGRVSWWD